MNKTMRWSALALGLAVVGAHGYSNPIEGGSSTTVSNDWNVVMPWLMVGGNTESNSLVVIGTGQVNNQIGYIGNAASSSNNSALVTGAGAVWNNSSELSVGNDGSGNALIVADGGRVDTPNGYIGNNSGSNTATIDGSGSLLNADTLHVGHLGSGNNLLISNGGKATSVDGTVGYWIGADRNAVTVQGSNSLWQSTTSFTVGDYGSDNQLAIADGGRVKSPVVNLGVQSIASNNILSVTGNGSLLDASEIHIGGSTAGVGGTGNRIEVSNGGTVATTDLNLYSDNTFDLNHGGTLAVRTNFNAATPGFNFNSGGTLEVGGELTGMGSKIDDQRSVVMNGSNAVWTRTGRINVGYQGDSNNLIIENGGQVVAQDIIVSDGSTSSGNTIIVTGKGSGLTTTGGGGVVVGAAGSNNRIEVADGARLDAAGGIGYAILGYHRGANTNSMLVDGASVQLKQHMYVGWYGAENDLTVSNGGVIRAQSMFVGRQATADGNQATVTGSNSLLESQDNFFVGSEGAQNSLSIENGGGVVNRLGFIGHTVGSDSNSVFVTGTGSVWKNSEALYLGGHKSGANWVDGGTGNSLTVNNGGWVQVGDVGTNNFPDIGTLGMVSVGGLDGAEMVVANGSRVETGYLGIGMESNQVGSVVVKDDGTTWNQNGQVAVGEKGSGNELIIKDGASFSSIGGVLGKETGASGNRIVVQGSNSVWMAQFPSQVTGGTISQPVDPGFEFPATNSFPEIYVVSGTIFMDAEALVVGELGNNNRLEILDGGTVQSGQSWIGMKSGADSNAVVVAGAGSTWETRNLTMGGAVGFVGPQDLNGEVWFDGGRGNSLYVADGGLVSVGNDMHNRNYSLVNVESGGHIAIASNYYQDATSVLRFGVETNAVGAPLNPFVSVGGTAEFEAGATLQYHSNVGVLDFDTSYTNLIVEANRLIIGGITNANAVDLQAINLGGSLVDVMLWEENQDIYGLVGRRHLADSAGFVPGSQMAGVSREIDDLSLLGNPLAVEQINRLNGMSSAQQNAQLTQRYDQGTPTYRHRQGMLGGQKQVLAQSRAFQSGNRGAKPEGASGPHKPEQGLRGWMRGYGSWATHDGTSSFSGFDQNVYGTVVGLDKTFGHVLLGVAGGYSRSDLTQDNNDSSDAETGFGVLYVSFGSTDWFGDLNVSYGRSGIKNRTGTLLGGSGDFDADLYSVYLGGGMEVQLTEGGLLLTPEAAMNMGYYDQEGYVDGLMDIDAYDLWSVQSRFGAALALEKKTASILWKPEVRAYWLHEFNAAPDRLGYTLGGGRYTFGVQSPDEDILEAGTGLSATIRERLELSLDLDGQFSKNYSALTVGARIAYEF